MNIAIELFRQAVLDTYDHAFVVSADSDLIPALRAVGETFPQKALKVVFPPGLSSESLKQEVHSHMKLKEKHLRNHQHLRYHDG